MARSLTAGFITEIDAASLRPAILVKAEFDSGDVLAWTGIGDLAYGGDTYTGTGNLLTISSIEESQQLRANGVQFVLTGILSSLVSIALSEEYQWRPITAWFVVLDESRAIIADPYKIFSGYMDVMEINDDGQQSTITLNAENTLIGLRESKERRFTPEDQKEAFAGDLGLDFVPTIQDKDLVWGNT